MGIRRAYNALETTPQWLQELQIDDYDNYKTCRKGNAYKNVSLLGHIDKEYRIHDENMGYDLLSP